jgi:NAD(P)-dependent dehydrogenase (short-subunit alcohol dehydrogenase family)
LTKKGITAFSSTADVAETSALQRAISDLKQKLGGVNVLLYNAAVIKVKDILSETAEELAADFKWKSRHPQPCFTAPRPSQSQWDLFRHVNDN